MKENWFPHWNSRGFIPGPQETEAKFEERIAFCENLEKSLREKGQEFPFQLEEEKSEEALREAFAITEPLYGVQPDWILLFFSNFQLAPWHGASTWIFQLTENSPTAAFLQLRAPLSKPFYLVGDVQSKRTDCT